jgi:uncharacterized protein YndB with AHSA1/START domain
MRTRTFTVYAAVSRAQVWRALTDPECTRRFYFGLAVDAEWRADGPIAYRVPGGAPQRPGFAAGSDGPGAGGCTAPHWAELHGHIVHLSPGHRLVHSLDETTAWGDAPESWVCWAVDEMTPGLCRIALTSDDLDPAGAGDRDEAWSRVLSGLKAVLESGHALRH